MKIKVHSSEINRMMKIVTQCIDPRFQERGSIELIYDNNLLSVRGTNGQISAVVSTPILGGTGEVFCVDGNMFARVCSMCNGEIEISTDDKNCIVKGAGRTRIPLLKSSIPTYKHVDGKSAFILADDITKCYKGISYAISEDQNRPQLTGVLTEITDNVVNLVALDGFQMSTETAGCSGDDMKITIPGVFMKLIVQGAAPGEKVKINTDGQRVEAITDGMMLTGGLLVGDYPDYKKILPKEFSTECLVKVDELRDALKCGSVINNKQNLIKMYIESDHIKIMSNSEEADYEADIHCDTHGNTLTIAFNQKYLMNTINAITTEEAIMKFNNSVSPCVVHGKNDDGIRLLLPVRIMG